MTNVELSQGGQSPERALVLTTLGQSVWEVLGDVSVAHVAARPHTDPSGLRDFYEHAIQDRTIVLRQGVYDQTFGMFTAPGIPPLIERELEPTVLAGYCF